LRGEQIEPAIPVDIVELWAVKGTAIVGELANGVCKSAATIAEIHIDAVVQSVAEWEQKIGPAIAIDVSDGEL
jgi:hypothetical protein